METIIKDNMLMDFPKGLESINGVMVAFTKVTLSKGSEMDMEYGVQIINNMLRVIKGIIQQTRSQAMEYTNGKMDGFIEETFRMIIETVMGNFLMVIRACIRDIGLMDSKLKVTHNLIHQKLQELLQVFK